MASCELARVSEAGDIQAASGMKASGGSGFSLGDAKGVVMLSRDSCSKTSGMLPSVGEKGGRGDPGAEAMSRV